MVEFFSHFFLLDRTNFASIIRFCMSHIRACVVETGENRTP